MNNNSNTHLVTQDTAVNILMENGLITPISDNHLDFSNNLNSGSQYTDDTPWFLQIFLASSGLSAGLFLIGFLSLLLDSIVDGFLDSHITHTMVGIILLFISHNIFKSNQNQSATFLRSLALAMSIAGQMFLVIFLFDISLPIQLSVWLFMLLQVLLFLLIPNFLHQLINCLFALSSLVWLTSFYGAPEVAAGLLALITSVFGLQRYEILQYIPMHKRAMSLENSRVLAYASSIILLIVSVYFITAEYYGYNILANGTADGQFYYHYSLAQGLLILATLYAAYVIMKRYQIKLLSTTNSAGMIIIAATIFLGVLSVYVSGLLATSLVIVIAMANRQRVLMSLGITALVSYIFWYYYQLDTTLLLKSLSMLAVGVGVLFLRWVLIKKLFVSPPTDAPQTHAHNMQAKKGAR